MTTKYLVLGAGLVGGAMVKDLAGAKDARVSVADISQINLSKLEKIPNVSIIEADLSDAAALRRITTDCDIVLDAVPGFMGFQTFRTLIEAGHNVVDIAFFAEDARELDDLAKSKNVTAIMDSGVAPGLSNVWIGEAASQLSQVDSVVIYVGGLPAAREWPYEYKAVFSPIDVIEEYTRPARYVRDGKLVTMPALSEPELMEFSGVGTLEAFNTDGLRSIIHTIKAPDMKEKTLRYPGHIEKMRMLRETGFFSYDPIDIKGAKVRPIDVTARLLFPAWQLKEGDEDLTIMRVVVEGKAGTKPRRYTYDLRDRFDKASNTHSMARTTGYTATVVAKMVVEGVYGEKGVIFPEYIGRDKRAAEYLREGLAKRGVTWTQKVE